jgi:hypothetical protein
MSGISGTGKKIKLSNKLYKENSHMNNPENLIWD